MSDRRTGTFIYSTFRAALTSPPAFEELPPHPIVPGARILPKDGSFTVDGKSWTVRGCVAVGLDDQREPAEFVEPTGPIDVMAPFRTDGMTISVEFVAPRSVIEESDEKVVVVDGFGPVRRGSA